MFLKELLISSIPYEAFVSIYFKASKNFLWLIKDKIIVGKSCLIPANSINSSSLP